MNPSPARIMMKMSVALLCGVMAVVPVFADLNSSQAVAALERQYGPEKFDHIVSLRGVGGGPNPREWVVVAYDRESPTTLRSYWADATRVVTQGVNSSYYPARVPAGFVDAGKIKVDSERAFAIVDALAREDGVGFNEVSYTLRALDLTDDPIWVIQLTDARGQLVGRLVLSAESGGVLRRVWLTPAGERRGMQPFVRDTLAPANGVGRSRVPVGSVPEFPTREGDGVLIDPVPDESPLGLPPLPEVDVTAGIDGFDPSQIDREKPAEMGEPELAEPPAAPEPDPLYQELPEEE